MIFKNVQKKIARANAAQAIFLFVIICLLEHSDASLYECR